jgi:hypothetical protein
MVNRTRRGGTSALGLEARLQQRLALLPNCYRSAQGDCPRRDSARGKTIT